MATTHAVFTGAVVLTSVGNHLVHTVKPETVKDYVCNIGLIFNQHFQSILGIDWQLPFFSFLGLYFFHSFFFTPRYLYS